MAAASRNNAPVIPPRINVPRIPPRHIDRQRRSVIGTSSSQTGNNRRSSNVAPKERTSNHKRTNSDASTGSVNGNANESTGNSSYMCSIHAENQVTMVCTNCVELLCNICIAPVNNKHAQCTLSYVGDNLNSICEQVKSSLYRKMDSTKVKMADLFGTLSRKQERMIKKRNETITRVEGFFQWLKEKMLEKLKREEEELLVHLQGSVEEQNKTLSENIQQCSSCIHDIQQKSAMLENLGRLHGISRDDAALLKSLLCTAAEVNKDYGYLGEITAARDAFLVIRFIVNPEAEQAILTSKVASVEVLSSRSVSPDIGNTEGDSINEVNGGSSGSIEGIETPDGCEEQHSNAQATHDISENMPPDAIIVTDAELVVDLNGRDDSRASSATPSSEMNADRTSGDTSSINNVLNATSDGEDSDEDPPPPYPGPPASGFRVPVRSPGPNDLPPPYPEHPPPAYVQLPEPQQPTDRRSIAQANISETTWRQSTSPDVALRTNARPETIALPIATSPSEIVQTSFPIAIRPRGPLKVFSVNEISDKRSSGINSMAVFNDNSFLIIDRWNRKLKFFNDSGVSLGGVLFREEPWDITQVTDEIFAITVPKLFIIYKVKASAQAVVTIGNVATDKRYACLAYHRSSQLFVCGQVPQFGEPLIDVFSVDGGPILLCFRADTMGSDLFSYPRYVEVSGDGTVVVCDWNLKCLFVFKLDGTVIGRYKGAEEFVMKEPTGISLYRDTDTLYVIDSKQTSINGAVHKLSLDCRCEQIYRGQNEFRDARAVAVYGQRMAVGSKNGILSIFSTRQRYQ